MNKEPSNTTKDLEKKFSVLLWSLGENISLYEEAVEILETDEDFRSYHEYTRPDNFHEAEEDKPILEKKILEELKSVDRFSEMTNFFFSDCSLKVYLKNLRSLYFEYKKEKDFFPNLRDFLDTEFRKFKGDRSHTISFETHEINYDLFFDKIFDYRVAERQKKDLISSYISRLDKSDNEFYIDKYGRLIEITRSEKIVEEICVNIKKYRTLEKDFKALDEAIHDEDFDNQDFINAERDLEELKSEIIKSLDELYEQSQIDNYQYPDSTFKVFEKNLLKDIADFKTINPDAEEVFFYKPKLHYYKNINKYRSFFLKGLKYDYGDFLLLTIKYKSSNDKKIEFLQNQIEKLGFITVFEEQQNNIVVELIDKKTIDNNKPDIIKNEIQPISKEEINIVKESNNKLKWTAGPSTLGFILGQLDSLGYLQTPKRTNGETNYSAFARQVLGTFEIKSTEDTLKKYLNLDSEKSQQISTKFEKENFNIPHSKSVGD